MIPSIFGLKGMAVAAGIALVIGSASGWKVRDAFCDAAAAKLEVIRLQKQVAARDAAAAEDQKLRDADAESKSQLEGAVRALQDKISAGECLPAADADRLRDLWR